MLSLKFTKKIKNANIIIYISIERCDLIMNFNKENQNKIEEFSKMTIDEQYSNLKKFSKNYELFESIILKSYKLLSKIKNNILYEDASEFENLTIQIQREIINNSLEELYNISSENKKNIIGYCKDFELQTKLCKLLEYKELLKFETSNNILYYLSLIKDDDFIVECINDEELFNKIISKSWIIRDILKDYNFDNFSYLTDKVQIQIINKVKNLDNLEVYEKLLQEASIEVINQVTTKIPEEYGKLFEYYIKTKNEQAKKILLEKMKDNQENLLTYFENLDKLINLFPKFINDKELKKIIEINSISNLLNIKFNSIMNNQLESNLENMDYQKNQEYIKKLVKEKIFNNLTSEKISNYDMDKIINLFENDERLEELLDKLEPKDILMNINNKLIIQYIIKKIKINQSYFLQVTYDELKSNIFIKCYDVFPSGIVKFEKIEDLEYIYKHLKKEVGIALYSKTNEEIEIVSNKLKNNPELINYVNDEILAVIIEKNMNENINLEKLITNKLFEIYKLNKNDKIKREIFKRLTEGTLKFEVSKAQIIPPREDGLNTNELKEFYKLLSDSEKEEFIDLLNSDIVINFYFEEKNLNLKNNLFNKIIEKQNDIFKKYNHVVSDFLNLPKEKYYELFEKFNDNTVLNIFYNYSSPYAVEKVIERFIKNNHIFSYNKNGEEIFEKLPLKEKNIIKNKLDKLLKDNLSKELYDKVVKNDTILNFKIIEAIERRLFNDRKILNIFNYLIDKNPFIVSTLNLDILFEEELYKKNKRFLSKITKYTDIQERIINLKNKKQYNFYILKNMINNISKNNNKVFDKIILIILEGLEKINFQFNHELNNLEIENLINYLIVNKGIFQFANSKIDLTGINPLNFREDLERKCDLEFKKENKSLVDLKNLYFIKYFNLDYSQVLEFIRMYDNNKEGVIINKRASYTLEKIKTILKSEEIQEIRYIYNNEQQKDNINDILNVEYEFQKAYTNELKNNLFKKTNTNMNIMVDKENIKVIDSGTNFKLLVHSTNAYSKLPIIDNNYYKSWNLQRRVNNHGICTSLISDINLGIPPLADEEPGVIFAFNNFSYDSISNMAPYDLCSSNDEYELMVERPLIYSNTKDIISKTRHTHNEYVLERLNLRDNSSINIQPNYIIIHSKMSEYQRKEALKASKEMNFPLGIPIIYINIEKIIETKKQNIEEKIEKFKKTRKLNLLEKVLDEYETIKCSLNPNWKDNFIEVEIIDKIIVEYIEFCNSKPESEKISKLLMLEKVLNNEKQKFDLIIDSGNRVKSFDINYIEHISNIYNSIHEIEFIEKEESEKYKNVENEVLLIQKENKIILDLKKNSFMTTILEKMATIEKNSQSELNILKYICLSNGEIKNIIDKNKMTNDIKNKIKVIIEYQKIKINDMNINRLMNKYQIPLNERKTLERLCNYFKDITELEKIRIKNKSFGLNPNKLKYQSSKILIPYAKKIYKISLNVDK